MLTPERCPNCFGELPMDPCRHCGWQMGTKSESFYLSPNTLLDGRYRIGKVLGHGGFGITYLGWDENLNIRLAIKEYLPRDLATRAAGETTVLVTSSPSQNDYMYGLTQFQEEARILARFQQHPSIVNVYNFFLANGTGYMVMEYVDGSTLKAFLGYKKVLSYGLTCKILLPVMDALRAVHAEGLLHRDIAPDNVYITRDQRVKLLDFGAARCTIGQYSRSLSVILKPGYAPEEQYRSRGEQGPWTDIYGLAATFYRCLTGEKPSDALDRLAHDDLRAPSSFGITLPAEAEQMLLRGLAVKAADRPPNMASFQQPFLKHGRGADGQGLSLISEAKEQQQTPIQGDAPQTEETFDLTPGLSRGKGKSPVRLLRGRLDWVGWMGLAGALWLFSSGEPTLSRMSGVLGILLIALWVVRAAGSRRMPAPIDPQTQFALGLKYETGDGVVANVTQAMNWYRKAATQGHSGAQFNLGRGYSEGRGVPQDDLQAITWWCKAAEQGDTKAQFMLGVMYTSGRGVPQDDALAVTWYRKAAEQGHGWAQVSLGVVYAEGRGVHRDTAQAIAWYRQAAAGSDPEAVQQAREALVKLGAL